MPKASSVPAIKELMPQYDVCPSRPDTSQVTQTSTWAGFWSVVCEEFTRFLLYVAEGPT